MSSIAELLATGHEAVNRAREIILTHSTADVWAKGDRDFVSEVDLTVERSLRELLSKRTPAISFLGEEEGGRHYGQTRLAWVLDPLDGTSNFLHRIPLCGVSLGLLDDGKPVLGIVDLPLLNERYHAVAGQGAHRDGRRIEVRKTAKIADAIVSIGDYAVGSGADEKNRLRFALTQRLAASAERVRMFGSAAIDLVWVASGRTDASITLSNKPWDMTAGVVIAREASAQVLDSDGSDHTLSSLATVATSDTLAPAILDILRRSMEDARPRLAQPHPNN
jgi:myo-inositol-1(or 4)-monophosphatase